MLSKMIPGGGSQGMLVQNVLDIRKGKRFLSFPGPGARVTQRERVRCGRWRPARRRMWRMV
jgi:hypothetical protein